MNTMTQKIVINSCFGGFGLSPAAIHRLAELKGRPCYFFRQEGFRGPYVPVTETNDERGLQAMLLRAFDIPNPNEVLGKMEGKAWQALSHEEKNEQTALFAKHSISQYSLDRSDPDLVKVVQEMGSELASGACAKLKIVEIPAGIEWELDEYDGVERVEEKHQSWA